MSYRGARRLHVLLMSWITLTFVSGWLPFIRGAMDGPTYQWGDSLFAWNLGGAGTAGDYWYAALTAALGLGLLTWGWRWPNGAFRPVLVAWLVLMLASTLYKVAVSPDEYRVKGDTLDIDVSLAVVAPTLLAIMAGLAAFWLRKAPSLPVPPFGRTNLVLILIAILLLPLQYALLSRGQGQESSDVLGVLLTIAGWVSLSAGLGIWQFPRASRTRLI